VQDDLNTQKVMAQQNAKAAIAFGIVLGIFFAVRLFVFFKGNLAIKLALFLLVMLAFTMIGYVMGH
jgi:hypothetical protein